MIPAMLTILHSLGMFVADLFKPRCRLEAENLFLRHQLSIALRRAPSRLRLRGSDRALLVWMTRLWPSLLAAAQVVDPETILRWHRAGWKAFWRWKSRNRAGRPKIDRGLRDLIQRMSKENQQWGASRIHGELLILGFEVAQSTVSKYMVRGGTPPSQSWKTFLRNHAQAIAAIDLCMVPTLTFDRLFAFLVLGHGRRRLLWFEVTRHPTAEWLVRQLSRSGRVGSFGCRGDGRGRCRHRSQGGTRPGSCYGQSSRHASAQLGLRARAMAIWMPMAGTASEADHHS